MSDDAQLLLISTDFVEMVEFYMKSIQHLDPDKQRVAKFAFISGMSAGTGVMQNRLAVTANRVAKMSETDKVNVMKHLADTCTEAAKDLEKLNLDTIGAPYGTA